MIKWELDPFPYCVIDNFLSNDDFQKLKEELKNTNNFLQTSFNTPLEKKSIYKDKNLKSEANKIIKIMSSKRIKDIIASQIKTSKIISLAETEDFSGYSPYHVTTEKGSLGSHVDHSYIEEGRYRHIANTIFYASEKWVPGWGGETILFSRNGLKEIVRIEPLPNRLILFIHTANSFHGVNIYKSNNNIERRTFYHDYYVSKNEIETVMKILNINRKKKLIHSIHGTTFIPSIPFGIKKLKIRKILDAKNLRYIPTYLIYYLNRITKSYHYSYKTVPFIKYFYYIYKFIKRKVFFN